MRRIEEIHKRLLDYEDVLELEGRDREKMYKILKRISELPDGTTISALKGSTKTESAHVNAYYLLAAKRWLRDRGYIWDERVRGLFLHKKLIKLTEKGKEALVRLEPLVPMGKPEVEVVADLGPALSKAKATIECYGLDDWDRLLIISDPVIYKRIEELVANLAQRSFSRKFSGKSRKSQPSTVTVNVQIAGHAGGSIPEFLSLLWQFYCRIITGSYAYACKDDPLDVDLHATSFENLDKYNEYWQKKHAKALRLLDSSKPPDLWKEILLEESIPSNMEMRILIEDDPLIREWINRKLDEDSDFFMPHLFWVFLGFRERRDAREFQKVSPPRITYLAYPTFEKTLRQLNDCLSQLVAYEKGDRRAKELIESTTKLLKLRGREETECAYLSAKLSELFSFDDRIYQSWTCLKRRYGGVLPRISMIFDKAQFRHVVKSHKSVVDLPKVFWKLAKKDKTFDEILTEIAEGIYDLDVPQTAQEGTLVETTAVATKRRRIRH